MDRKVVRNIEKQQELKELAQEAKSYKSIEEFVSAQIFGKSISGSIKAVINKRFNGDTFADKLENFYNQVIKQ